MDFTNTNSIVDHYKLNNGKTAPQGPERGSGSLDLPLHLSGHVGGAGWTDPGRRGGRVRGCVHRGPGTRHPHHRDWKVSPFCGLSMKSKDQFVKHSFFIFNSLRL